MMQHFSTMPWSYNLIKFRVFSTMKIDLTSVCFVLVTAIIFTCFCIPTFSGEIQGTIFSGESSNKLSSVKVQLLENPQFVIIRPSKVIVYRIGILFSIKLMDTRTKLGRFNQVGKII